MPVAGAFVTVAFFLYSVAIWSERCQRKLALWMTVLMAFGFLADSIGTGMMMQLARENGLRIGVHGCFGYVALAIMFLHLAWALGTVFDERWQSYFSRFSVWAWCLWVVAFVIGGMGAVNKG